MQSQLKSQNSQTLNTYKYMDLFKTSSPYLELATLKQIQWTFQKFQKTLYDKSQNPKLQVKVAKSSKL